MGYQATKRHGRTLNKITKWKIPIWRVYIWYDSTSTRHERKTMEAVERSVVAKDWKGGKNE